MTQQAPADQSRIWIACIPKLPGVAKPHTAIALARCRVCGERIWVAPSTIEILLTRAELAHPLCTPCWVTHMKEHPKDWKNFTVHSTERQRAEIMSAAGVDVQDAIRELFGIEATMLDLKGRS